MFKVQRMKFIRDDFQGDDDEKKEETKQETN